MTTDLTAQTSHFAFGDNWRDFAALVDDERIESSDAGIERLFAPGELRGKSVIDIGCGSGLPALSMLRAGAKHVTCVDIDPASVAAARQTLGDHAPPGTWSAEVGSVFDLEGQYDIVYSWGVLHHTGDMARAIAKARQLVRPGGLLAIAIYVKTPLCGFWRAEKRFYAHAPGPVQAIVLALFATWRTVLELRYGGNPWRRVLGRGMSRRHDDHDWLGGWPYESATRDEVVAMTGLELQRFIPVSGRHTGVLGSGCAEYVFRA